MRFVVDMNLSPKWAAHLSKAGHDAVHWSAVGMRDTDDGDIADWAETERRVILTADRDFSAILAMRGAAGPSVVQLRSANLRVSAIGDAVLAVIEEARSDLTAGALLSFDGYRARLRLLPIE